MQTHDGLRAYFGDIHNHCGISYGQQVAMALHGKAKVVKIVEVPDPELGCLQGYMSEPTYDRGYSQAPGFKGIKAQKSLDHRYFDEDVGYGLVFLKTLGDSVGVPTPYASAVIELASLLTGGDYSGKPKRTVESLGLSGYTARQLEELLA